MHVTFGLGRQQMFKGKIFHLFLCVRTHYLSPTLSYDSVFPLQLAYTHTISSIDTLAHFFPFFPRLFSNAQVSRLAFVRVMDPKFFGKVTSHLVIFVEIYAEIPRSLALGEEVETEAPGKFKTRE